MSKPVDFDIQRVIDYLQGTCESLDSGLETCFPGMVWEDLTSEDHQAIDNEIFLCEQCGWWCEVGEGHENTDGGGDLCSDCHSENNDEEDE